MVRGGVIVTDHLINCPVSMLATIIIFNVSANLRGLYSTYQVVATPDKLGYSEDFFFD
jgi:hypothetical protein